MQKKRMLYNIIGGDLYGFVEVDRAIKTVK